MCQIITHILAYLNLDTVQDTRLAFMLLYYHDYIYIHLIITYWLIHLIVWNYLLIIIEVPPPPYLSSIPPENTKHLYNIYTILDQRRRLKSLKQDDTTLYKCYKCFVFAGPLGGGPRVVVSSATFHARVRFPVSAVWKKQKYFFPIHV